MNKFLNYLINSIYIFSLKRSYKDFFSFKDINKIQNELLLKVISDNKSSLYGVLYGFRNIENYEQFKTKVPITTYEDYEPYIEKISNGELNILTTEKVLLLEPTSGSSSKKKLIPYTKSLKKQFQKGINPWLFNLYQNYRSLKYGKSYWSISPSNEKEYTKGGIPIGFEEDGAYLGFVANTLMKFIFAVPQDIKNEKSMSSFYLKTAKYLLNAKDLSIISIWHPSFLMLILDFMEENVERLELSVEDELKLLNKEYQSLWPELKIISCWTAGNSKDYYKKLRELFPNAVFQGKGLISTEAFSSFPIVEAKYPILSVHSHFFEFKNLKTDEIFLADNLFLDEQYELIVTTGGGFYRYNTKDVIVFKGNYKGYPTIEFLGKNDLIVDKFGEKLNEVFIKNALSDFGVKDEFCLLAFEEFSYVLYTNSLLDFTKFEERLKENYHYDYALKLGQLKNLRIFKLNGDPQKEYIEYCLSKGQKLGDIKINKLIKTSGLDRFFKGEYI